MLLRIIILVLLSCVSVQGQTGLKKDTLIHSQKLLLLREVCDDPYYDFCGAKLFDEVPKIDGFLIFLQDSLTILESYKEATFQIYYGFGVHKVNKQVNIALRSRSGMNDNDSLSNSKVDNELVFYSKLLKRKVKKSYIRDKLKNKYNGVLKYGVFEVDLEYIYVGNDEIRRIPNFFNKKSGGMKEDLKGDIFYILNIKSVKPVSMDSLSFTPKLL